MVGFKLTVARLLPRFQAEQATLTYHSDPVLVRPIEARLAYRVKCDKSLEYQSLTDHASMALGGDSSRELRLLVWPYTNSFVLANSDISARKTHHHGDRDRLIGCAQTSN